MKQVGSKVTGGSGLRFVRGRETEEAGECSKERIFTVIGFARGLDWFWWVRTLLYGRRMSVVAVSVRVSEAKSDRGAANIVRDRSVCSV